MNKNQPNNYINLTQVNMVKVNSDKQWCVGAEFY